MSELDSKDLDIFRKLNTSSDEIEIANSEAKESVKELSEDQLIINVIPSEISSKKLQSVNNMDHSKSFNINLKYLFIAVVYLKLRSDLYTNIGDRVLEIGINDIINVYGKGEVCQGKLGRYIDYVKSIVRDNKLGLKLEIPYESRKKLNFLYYKYFLK